MDMDEVDGWLEQVAGKGNATAVKPSREEVCYTAVWNIRRGVKIISKCQLKHCNMPKVGELMSSRFKTPQARHVCVLRGEFRLVRLIIKNLQQYLKSRYNPTKQSGKSTSIIMPNNQTPNR